jgi:mannose/cellobiose epimerase-like protein (N-acyl-D-glucosamine 2-epimerase family)
MHLTESLMATFEATKRFNLPRMAERMVGGFLKHFTNAWSVNQASAGSPTLGPHGNRP